MTIYSKGTSDHFRADGIAASARKYTEGLWQEYQERFDVFITAAKNDPVITFIVISLIIICVMLTIGGIRSISQHRQTIKELAARDHNVPRAGRAPAKVPEKRKVVRREIQEVEIAERPTRPLRSRNRQQASPPELQSSSQSLTGVVESPEEKTPPAVTTSRVTKGKSKATRSKKVTS